MNDELVEEFLRVSHRLAVSVRKKETLEQVAAVAIAMVIVASGVNGATINAEVAHLTAKALEVMRTRSERVS